MKILFLLTAVCVWTLSKAQEPDRVKILHQDAIPTAYVETFNEDEVKLAAGYVLILQVAIKSDGSIFNPKIQDIDSSSIIFKKQEQFLRLIEQKVRIEFYSKTFRNFIRKSKDQYCISMLIRKGSIFDYENEPFKCK